MSTESPVHIAALESAESGIAPNLLVTIVAGILLLVFLLLVVALGLAIGVNAVNYIIKDRVYFIGGVFLGMVAVMGVVYVFAIRKAFWETVYWCIGSDGVTAKAPVWSTSFGWGDIRRIRTAKSRIWGDRVVFELASGIVHMPSKVFVNPMFEASLWQYAKEQYIRSGLRISGDAKSFFMAIPDSVPRTIDWAYYEYGESSESGEPDVFIELRPDEISSTAYGERATISWMDVTRAYWEDNVLMIQGKSNLLRSDEIQVPVVFSNIDSASLALAIVRRLREMDPAILLVMPQKLRSGARGILRGQETA